jgi:hypothetical protein
MIMKTTKTFALVALAALSLGMGTVMAQSETPIESGNAYWSVARQADALRQMEGRAASRVQAGSSDVGTAQSGTSHVLPFNLDYTTLANPG